MNASKPFLYFEGLKKLANEVCGDETIHIGIRPYGYHAGNDIALIVYPLLLCKYVEELGKKAQFTFFYSINDMEQDNLDGPDFRKYPFNIFPQNTSLQHTTIEGSDIAITDYWQPIIERRVHDALKNFPNITLSFVRNSSLKDHPFFKKILIETLQHSHKQLEIYKKYSVKEILAGPTQYTGAICGKCESAHGFTHISKDGYVFFSCLKCEEKTEGGYEIFDYWFYHKPLLIARLKIFGVDITLSGGDHFHEGDFEMRNALIDTFAPEIKKPIMLFTPTLLALDGEKMSKSRSNAKSVDIDKFIVFIDNNHEKEIRIPQELCV